MSLGQGSPNSSVHRPFHEVSDCSSTPKHLLYKNNLINTTFNNNATNKNNIKLLNGPTNPWKLILITLGNPEPAEPINRISRRDFPVENIHKVSKTKEEICTII